MFFATMQLELLLPCCAYDTSLQQNDSSRARQWYIAAFTAATKAGNAAQHADILQHERINRCSFPAADHLVPLCVEFVTDQVGISDCTKLTPLPLLVLQACSHQTEKRPEVFTEGLEGLAGNTCSSASYKHKSYNCKHVTRCMSNQYAVKISTVTITPESS